MDAKQHLYYALGLFAYAVAKADGKVQNEERQMIHDIVLKESQHHIDFYYAEIIFNILQKDDANFLPIYEWASKDFRLGKRHLTPKMKQQFVSTIKKIAEAFPPSTDEENKLIDKISRNIWSV